LGGILGKEGLGGISGWVRFLLVGWAGLRYVGLHRQWSGSRVLSQRRSTTGGKTGIKSKKAQGKFTDSKKEIRPSNTAPTDETVPVFEKDSMRGRIGKGANQPESGKGIQHKKRARPNLPKKSRGGGGGGTGPPSNQKQA